MGMWRGHEATILSPDALERRASGRRHYNSVRQFRAALRRVAVARLVAQGVARAEIALRLGCDLSTISRDLKKLLTVEPRACPTCGRPFEPREDARFPPPAVR